MSDVSQWYIPNPDNGEVVGPISLQEVHGLIEAGKLRMDSFIWSPKLETHRWHRLYEIKDFQKFLAPVPLAQLPRHLGSRSAVRKPLSAAMQDVGTSGNVYRRYPRIDFQTAALVHNQKDLLTSQVVDISEKGASLTINGEKAFDKGDEVTITFRNGKDNLGTFSVPAVVIRVESQIGSTKYGLFFLRLNPRIRRKIAHHVMKVLSGESSKLESA